MSTALYAVEGLACESCMAAVQERVQSLSGVTVVAMDLVAGGRSPLIVTSGTKLGATRCATRWSTSASASCTRGAQRWAVVGVAWPLGGRYPSGSSTSDVS